MRRPYLASDDSALLRDVLRAYSGGSALEIGAGNGGNLIALASGFRTVVGTDILMPGMADWKNSATEYIMADCASCLRPGSFDLVAFNPPYLPSESALDVVTDGGTRLDVPMKFLRSALCAVKRTGKIVMLLNDEATIEEFTRECSRQGFRLSKVTTKHLFFERLTVYEASAH